jgi:hypothetical protein
MKSVKPHQGRRALPYAVAVVLLIVAPTAAQAAFSGPYTPSNWTFSNGSQDGVAANGEVDTSGAPGSITITGANDGVPGVNIDFNTDFTIAAAGTGPWSFDFDWQNPDIDPNFGPVNDFGGFLLNGVFTQFGGASTSGSENIDIQAGDIIGFRVNCTDCAIEPGVLTISNFSAPVGVVSTPEPSTLILMALGAAGLAVGRLRRRDK